MVDRLKVSMMLVVAKTGNKYLERTHGYIHSQSSAVVANLLEMESTGQQSKINKSLLRSNNQWAEVDNIEKSRVLVIKNNKTLNF